MNTVQTIPEVSARSTRGVVRGQNDASLVDRLIERLEKLAMENELSRELGRFVVGSLSPTVSDGGADRDRLCAPLAEAEYRLGRE